ncbi:leucine-rich repeat-containing protein 28-like [Cydia fagiglandana]|uniref:leucine-rich repeat-containing protein 28-like n=1 Tax=Cydia fagiglandana TaxID=1458189 RepID=UPI002FEE12C3
MDYSENNIPTVVLHWNYRGFTQFPLHLLKGEESEITDIYLKENLISRLPSDIGRLEHLESLYLSGNDIAVLPREISKLRSLKCLDVSGNRLRYIPDEIGDVRSLKFLILDENELTELPLRIAELRALRYLSVCDNNLQWLPQRPVYNQHHCEFRFWRNNLKAIPFSLWYHMFRDQQTRSFGMGKPQAIYTNQQVCRLTVVNENGSYKIDIPCPPQHQNILESTYSPPNLYELCRRRLYAIISETARKLSTDSPSIYSDYYNRNVSNIQNNFLNFNLESKNIPSEDKNGNYEFKVIPSVLKNGNKTKEQRIYAPSDIVDKYHSFLPNFMKRELRVGPISKCENAACKKPTFDFVLYEFCLGEIILIDRTETVILSAVFCSKTCSEVWKRGRTNVIPWTLVQNN